MVLSLLVAAYNSEEYVLECLNPIIKQMVNLSFDDCELIVIDDGSTDNTHNIIKNIDLSGCNVKIFTRNNKGVSLTRKELIKKSSGDYLCFVDSDDIISDSYLSDIIKIINTKKFDVLEFGLKRFDDINEVNIFEQHKFKLLTNHEQNLHSAFLRCEWHMCSRVFSKRVLLHHMFDGLVYFEDAAIIPYIYLKANKIIRLDSNIYYYRNNLSGITKNYTMRHVKSWDIVIAKAISYHGKEYKQLSESKKLKFDKYAYSLNKVYTKTIARSDCFYSVVPKYVAVSGVKLYLNGQLSYKDFIYIFSPKIYSMILRLKYAFKKAFN
ncbi:glycosyltransferase family 2 protein [Vibrio breoganii]